MNKKMLLRNVYQSSFKDELGKVAGKKQWQDLKEDKKKDYSTIGSYVGMVGAPFALRKPQMKIVGKLLDKYPKKSFPIILGTSIAPIILGGALGSYLGSKIKKDR